MQAALQLYSRWLSTRSPASALQRGNHFLNLGVFSQGCAKDQKTVFGPNACIGSDCHVEEC